jgi:hypothetical protein
LNETIVGDDRPLDGVEIGPPGLPVIRVLRHLDVLVRLELDEFEGAGADRVLPHLGGRHMARVDRTIGRGQHHRKGRLRPLHDEGDRVIALGHDTVEVAVPRLARVQPQLVLRLADQQLPGASDIGGGEGFPVMPSDALAQFEAEPGVVGVPGPAFRQLGLDELQPVLLFVLVEQDEVVEHRHHRADSGDRRLLMDRHARRAVAVEEAERPAALLRRRRAGEQQGRDDPHGGERPYSSWHTSSLGLSAAQT